MRAIEATRVALFLSLFCSTLTGCVLDPDTHDIFASPNDEAISQGLGISPPPGQSVRLFNQATDRCLTFVSGEVFTTAAGCSTTNPFQRWRLDQLGSNLFEIVSVGATAVIGQDICLTLGVPDPGAAPQIAPCDLSISQEWLFTNVQAHPPRFEISNEGVAIHAGSGGPNVVVLPPTGSPLAKWTLLP